MLTEEEKVMKGAQLKAGRGKQTWLEKQPEPGVGLGGSDQMLFGPPPPALLASLLQRSASAADGSAAGEAVRVLMEAPRCSTITLSAPVSAEGHPVPRPPPRRARGFN